MNKAIRIVSWIFENKNPDVDSLPDVVTVYYDVIYEGTTPVRRKRTFAVTAKDLEAKNVALFFAHISNVMAIEKMIEDVT